MNEFGGAVENVRRRRKLLVERVAAAMHEAPDPADPDAPVTPWPPSHPEDLAWWLTRAEAAINTLEES